MDRTAQKQGITLHWYTPVHMATNRVLYTMQQVTTLLGFTNCICTQNIIEAENWAADKLVFNYSDDDLTNAALHIWPHTFMQQKGIGWQQKPIVGSWNNLPILFETQGALGFDVLAATFYCISRYEEYLPHTKDVYGRYAHTNSWSYQTQALHLPLVNMWWQTIAQQLSEQGWTIPHKPSSFTLALSVDVDIAFKAAYHSVIKTLGSAIKHAYKGQLKKFFQAIKQPATDEFNTFSWLIQLCTQANVQPIFFVLLAAERSQYDKNNTPNSKGFQRFLQHLQQQHLVYLHPSYQSYFDPRLLHTEAKTFEAILGKPATQVRQHYIQFTLPYTYRNYLQQGITTDYSMGYGSINGYRASIATPFYWFDVLADTATHLVVHPFALMDANFIFEEKQTPTQASDTLTTYLHQSKQWHLPLHVVLHNHFVTESSEFAPWRQVWEQFLGSYEQIQPTIS